MFERFTDRARTVVRVARDEARTEGQRPVGTEHLLLALLEHENGEGVLSGLGIGKAKTEEYVTEVLAEFLETSEQES